jgi:hypothetical protein
MDLDEYQTLMTERNELVEIGVWSGMPAVPATNVTATNTSDKTMWVEVALNGATVTGVKVDGVTIGARTSGMFLVRPQSTIAIVYSAGSPTWQWFELP